VCSGLQPRSSLTEADANSEQSHFFLCSKCLLADQGRREQTDDIQDGTWDAQTPLGLETMHHQRAGVEGRRRDFHIASATLLASLKRLSIGVINSTFSRVSPFSG